MGRRLLAVVVVAACSSAEPVGTRGVTPQAPDEALVARVIDEHGVPRLVTATTKVTRDDAIAHLTAIAGAWKVSPETMPSLSIIGTAGSITRVRQTLDGLPVDGELRVMTDAGGALIAASGILVGTDLPRPPARFAFDDKTALATAVGIDARQIAQSGARFRGGSIELAAVKRSWLRRGNGLVAGWIVEAYLGQADSTHSDLVRVLLDGDGRILERHSLVADAVFKYRVFANELDLSPLDGPIADVSPHPTGIPDGNFPAFIAPVIVGVDGLNHPAGSSVPDPWLVAGRTETQGNNVEAYADLNAPSGLTFGDFRATATAPGFFDRAFDTSAGPLVSQDQQMASITSLFYVINWLHDFWYDAGFTEGAGNAQDANYGRGGEDRDAILAEAQDNALGGSRNNANMATPADGLPPRMQVFLWSGLDEHSLTVQDRTPVHSVANYGVSTFDVTGEVVLADDGTGDNPADLCEPITNDVAGKIVLVDRGICTFESKALKIQNAGGIGMILANNVDTNPPTMGDDVETTEPITIAQLSVLQAEGAAIKAELLAGPVTATLHRLVGPELDGAVDATLIAHEFGHYLHHRLQPCNSRMCGAISEGWGDFLSLMLIAREGDDLTKAYPFAVYATRTFSDDAEYFGIRRAPYSVDPAINALSFRHMSAGAVLPDTHPFLAFGSANEVHNAGEVWTSAMWEAYVALQQARGAATFEATRTKMAGYVVSGLLLAPVDGTPTETRDAILIAARATSQADHDTLAAAFARRGLGSCAVSPDRQSTDFTGITESTVVQANVVMAAPVLSAVEPCDDDNVIDAGERGRIAIALSNIGGKPLAGATASLTTTTAGVTIHTPPRAVDLDAHATATLEFDITVDPSFTEPLAGAFDLAITGAASCTPLTLHLDTRLNVDDRVSQSATDSFDSIVTPWQATLFPIWKPSRPTALDGEWHGGPPAAFADGSLESPLLTGGAGPITLTFEHRYAFEVSGEDAFDGGVLEVSLDGTIWQDVSTIDPTLPYGLVITGVGQALAGRRGFTGTNPSFPATDTVTVDLSALAGTLFKLRFRIASDNSNASPGWDVDNVAFTGLATTPFPIQVANVRRCDDVPPADGGVDPLPPGDGGCCGTGSSSGSLLLGVGVLALVFRRRR